MVTLETTGGPDGRSTDRATQAFDRAVVALVATCAVYTLWRGATLQVEYYDGYRYLANASRLLGEDVSFDQIRPPLLTLLLVPVVALGRLGGPANTALVFGPHLFSAVLSLCTAAAVFVLFAAPCGRRVALVGTLLFMTSRYFLRLSRKNGAVFSSWSLTTMSCSTRWSLMRSTSSGAPADV